MYDQIVRKWLFMIFVQEIIDIKPRNLLRKLEFDEVD